jgi:saccharopine dehydrogenase-like NADP-dependent oxidoreductase
MGRIIVRDLIETAPPDIDILVADRDLPAARAIVSGLSRRVKLVEVDATQPRRVAKAVGQSAVLINACHHSLNLHAMDTALRIGSHYCDLGGLFHVTRQQLRRHAEFDRRGLLALCGIGSAPGIVNVMARAGADRFERVREVHIAVGTSEGTPGAPSAPLETSYSIHTVLDEASLPAAVFTKGVLRFVEPLSLAQPVVFPPPIGRQYPACTLHSELATLPQSFRSKGIREVSFKIAFPGGLADRLRFVHEIGLTSTVPVSVAGRRIAPRDVLLALIASAPKPAGSAPKDEYEILRVTIRGQRGGRQAEEVLDCHVPGMPAWEVGVDIDTGAPPSIAAQLLVSGVITARGVRPPEQAVPPEPFFRALRARRMRVVRRWRKC